MKVAAYVLLGLGICSALIFGLLAVITLIVMLTSNGRVDGEEAAPFIGLGCCCSVVGVMLATGGLILLLTGPKK